MSRRRSTGARAADDRARGRRPQVVIVGAGFGGLSAARALRHAEVDTTIVDRHNYHLFQPLLYQVASGLLDPSEIAHPVRATLRKVRNATVQLATVTAIDVDARRVTTDQGGLDYDFLIVAAGSTTNFFGNMALEASACGLKTLDDALHLRGRVIAAFERAVTAKDADERHRLLTFAIVGAGPTGVEYAGALSELIAHVLPKDFPGLNFGDVRVLLIEGGAAVLPAFAPRLRSKASRALERKGTVLRMQRLVASADKRGIVLDNGERIDAATVVWTAGVQAEPIAEMLGAQPDRLGRVSVNEQLRLPGHPEVFVIGDGAATQWRGAALPMLAPVAIQGGQHAALAIIARLRDETDPPPFRYRDKGTMATVGRNIAVVQLGPLRFGGFIGWLAWLFVHLLYIVSFRSRLVVLINWGWNYLFYDRPIRLITEAADQRKAGGASPATAPAPSTRREHAGASARSEEKSS